MNQSPKKNKYIIKNQKLCSIPFLPMQPSSNTSSAHGKPLRSQQRRRLHVQLGTYTGNASSKVEPQATGGILDAKFLHLGKRHPPGSQLSAFHWRAFTQGLLNLVLFRKYRLNTHVGSARAWPWGEGQAVWRVCMLLVAVEASSCINVSWMCISNYAAWLVSQYFWHQPRQSIIQLLPLPFDIFLGRGQRAKRLSQDRDSMREPHIYALLKDCAKGNTASETADYV